MINAVAFDVGEVLVFTNGFINFFLKEVKDVFNMDISKEEFSVYFKKMQCGKLLSIDYASKILGLDREKSTVFSGLFIASLEKNVTLNSELLDFIMRLTQKYKVGLITDVDEELAQTYINRFIYEKFKYLC